jgi:hypothetical protein
VKKMKNRDYTKKRIDEGQEPRYQTKRGKLLWIDTEHYDDYSSANHCHILTDAKNNFWGYSDSDQIEAI